MHSRDILAVVVLAEGEGTRMKSRRLKVLFGILGRSMLGWVLEAQAPLKADRVVVVAGHAKEKIGNEVRRLGYREVRIVIQKRLVGSGDAVLSARDALRGFQGTVLVLPGDCPMITTATLKRLIRVHRNSGNAATVLSAIVDDPFGYGRIKKSGNSISIIEEKDATPGERKIHKVNSGIYCFNADELFRALKKVKPDNKKHEYYLTDVIGIISNSGKKTGVVCTSDSFEITGINDRAELARVTKIANERNLDRTPKEMEDG